MSEYLKLKTFDANVEQNKHINLKNYFYERYKHVSDVLSEEQLTNIKKKDIKKVDGLLASLLKSTHKRPSAVKHQAVSWFSHLIGVHAEIAKLNQGIIDEVDQHLKQEQEGKQEKMSDPIKKGFIRRKKPKPL